MIIISNRITAGADSTTTALMPSHIHRADRGNSRRANRNAPIGLHASQTTKATTVAVANSSGILNTAETAAAASHNPRPMSLRGCATQPVRQAVPTAAMPVDRPVSETQRVAPTVQPCMRRSITLLLALVIVAAACGDDGSGSTPTPAPTTQPPAPPTTAEPTTPPTTGTPIDPDQAVLTIRREGGLLPPEFVISQLPLFTLYGDGRLVYQAAAPAIFPGPLVPSVVAANIGELGLLQVLIAVGASGLQNVTEEYNNDAAAVVVDGPNTEFTYVDANGEHFFSVYALSIAEHDDPQVQRLQELLAFVDELAATTPAEAFTPDRYQVVVSAEPPATDDPLASVVPWPLATPPDDMPEFDFALRCTVVETAAEPGAVAAFEAADQMTFFESDGRAYRLTVRPLLPGEDGCQTRRR